MSKKASIPVESLQISFRKVNSGAYEWSIAANGGPDLVSGPVFSAIDFDAGEIAVISLQLEEGSAWIVGTMETAVPDQLGEAQ